MNGVLQADVVVVATKAGGPSEDRKWRANEKPKRTVSPGTSLHSPCSCQSHSPSMPRRTLRDRPDTVLALDGYPIRPQEVKLRMVEHLCRNVRIRNTLLQAKSPCYQEGCLPGLGGLLHNGGNLLCQHACRGILSVYLPVSLCTLPCFGHQYAEVGAHARVDDANIWAYHSDPVNDGIIYEDRRCLLLSSDNNAVRGCIG